MRYLIEEIWLDRMENSASRAIGYDPIGYFDTLEETLKFVNTGKHYTKKDCWAVGETGMPQYRYKELQKL